MNRRCIRPEKWIPTSVNYCVIVLRDIKTAYTLNQFVFAGVSGIIRASIAPDLFVQMLDKLVANAVDFSAPSEPIRIGLQQNVTSWSITVTNYGSTLPESMEQQLFNSMISMRRDHSDGEPHLGLGLYVVRQIAEFHKGEISATNLTDRPGVQFTIRFPGANAGPA